MMIEPSNWGILRQTNMETRFIPFSSMGSSTPGAQNEAVRPDAVASLEKGFLGSPWVGAPF